jgi:hypothetical protein
MAIDSATGQVVWSHAPGTSSVINSSPAIDPSGQFVYMPLPDGLIHKYAVGDGAETTGNGWPQTATLKPLLDRANGSLAIATVGATTYLYSVMSGFQDSGDYQGHLTTVNLNTGSQVVFNSLCSDQAVHFVTQGSPDCPSTQSAIWGRGGAVYDPSLQRIYITTGNGPYDADTGGSDWGDSVLALAPDGTPATPGVPYDSYTPSNFQDLYHQDLDLGSMSVAIVPAPAGSAITHLGMQSGKDETIRLINLENMSGGGGPRHIGGEIQAIVSPAEFPGAREQSAVWVNPAGDHATWVFFASFRNGLSGFKLSLDGQQMPHLTLMWTKSFGLEIGTTSPVIANGVLYHVGIADGAPSNSLMARDPETGTMLWTSALFNNIHWQSPIVVNGTVYVADGQGNIKAFGLSGTQVTHTVTPVAGAHGTLTPSVPQTVNDGATVAFTVTPDQGYSIGSVTGCGGSLAGNVYTTAPVTADCTVTAAFAVTTHTVTPTATAGGTIDPDVPQTVADGAVTSFTLAPATNFVLAGVSGCNGSLTGLVYTTGPITADCTVAAVFSSNVDSIFSNGFDSI